MGHQRRKPVFHSTYDFTKTEQNFFSRHISFSPCLPKISTLMTFQVGLWKYMDFIALFLLLYRYILTKGSILSKTAYTDITISLKSSDCLSVKNRRHKFQCNYFLTNSELNAFSSYRVSL